MGSYAAVGALQSELETERQEAERATLDALEAMRAMDAGDQVKWRISRTGHENDELNGYLETWPNHLMTIERMRDRFGGGTFWCKGFRAGRYMAHKTLQISGDAKRKPSGVEGVNQSLPVASQGQAFDIQGFLTAQERRDERRREDERRERQEREERDEKRRNERMQLLLTLGPAAITALGGLFGGQRVDYMPLIAAMKGPDPITLLTQLKALQGSGDAGLMNKVLPMLIDMAGEKAGGGDTGWLDVIKEFTKSAGPAVGGMIEASLAQARANGSGSLPMTVTAVQPVIDPVNGQLPPQQPQTPLIMVPESVSRRERRGIDPGPPAAPGHPVSVPGRSTAGLRDSNSGGSVGSAVTADASLAPATTVNGEVSMLSLLPHVPWLKEQLARMGHAAVKGRDPEVYAALFLEELPEGVEPQTVAGLLSRGDWYGQLMGFEPRLNREDLVPWFTAVRTYILRQLGVSADAPGGTSPQPAPAQGASPARGGSPVLAVSSAALPTRSVAGSVEEVQRPTRIPSLMGD